jgi:hypothetical protein
MSVPSISWFMAILRCCNTEQQWQRIPRQLTHGTAKGVQGGLTINVAESGVHSGLTDQKSSGSSRRFFRPDQNEIPQVSLHDLPDQILDGLVANFGLLPGRYVNAGAAVFALIGSDTFRVEGYFEETKLRRIHIGEDATVRLIGDPRVLSGHVESITYGIEDQNRSTSSELLASVNPTFSWVRLAQRIPVCIKLDNVPPDLLLVAGRTATVSIGKISWW